MAVTRTRQQALNSSQQQNALCTFHWAPASPRCDPARQPYSLCSLILLSSVCDLVQILRNLSSLSRILNLIMRVGIINSKMLTDAQPPAPPHYPIPSEGQGARCTKRRRSWIKGGDKLKAGGRERVRKGERGRGHRTHDNLLSWNVSCKYLTKPNLSLAIRKIISYY